jgi:hypothetical protein
VALWHVGNVGYGKQTANIANIANMHSYHFDIVGNVGYLAAKLNRWLRPAIHDCGIYTTLFFNFFNFHS